MPSFLITLIEWIFILFPFIGIYVTFIHYRWWKIYRPSPLIRHLLISSIAVDIASILAFTIALGQILDIDLPAGTYTLLLAMALMISLGVKVWRRFDLMELDQVGHDLYADHNGKGGSVGDQE